VQSVPVVAGGEVGEQATEVAVAWAGAGLTVSVWEPVLPPNPGKSFGYVAVINGLPDTVGV
jgi:hypothetical protein